MQPVSPFHIILELRWSNSRSPGPGGQHVNKANTRVRLRWNILQSRLLSEEQRLHLLSKLAGRLTANGDLHIDSALTRSQAANRQDALAKLNELLRQAFAPTAARRATRPTAAARKKRLRSKKKQSEKKQWRRKL